MKKLLLTAAAGIIMAGSAYAGDIGKCVSVGEFAGKVMQIRQNGVKMSEIVNRLGHDNPLLSIVIDAYDTPRFRTEDYKEAAITKFENKYYMECVKYERKKK